MDTRVELPFADGTYSFWLPLPQVFEVERKTGDTSLLVLEERMRAAIGQDAEGAFVFAGGGAAMVADVREVIRCALIGGNAGMVEGEEIEVGPVAAKQLVDSYVYPARPLAEGVVLAWRILQAAIYGIRLDGSKKKTDSETGSPGPSLKDD